VDLAALFVLLFFLFIPCYYIASLGCGGTFVFIVNDVVSFDIVQYVSLYAIVVFSIGL